MHQKLLSKLFLIDEREGDKSLKHDLSSVCFKNLDLVVFPYFNFNVQKGYFCLSYQWRTYIVLSLKFPDLICFTVSTKIQHAIKDKRLGYQLQLQPAASLKPRYLIQQPFRPSLSQSSRSIPVPFLTVPSLRNLRGQDNKHKLI